MWRHLIVLASILFGLTCCDPPAKTPSKTAVPAGDEKAEEKAITKNDEPLKRDEWNTLAESTDFRATSDYAETMAFLKRLEAKMPEVTVSSFGRSAMGRDLPLVVVGTENTPKKAHESGKPIIMIQNAIHPGEVDGKDACLMILRDLLFGERRWILDTAILVIVPIYNVDGHERISPYNRPNQDGPFDGMGFRSTAQGLDLNRDHMKVKSPEMRALIALFNEWRPHLHVDNHVTDGCDHDWVLTYMMSEKPQIAEPIHGWLWTSVPKVLEAIGGMGHRTGPYVWLNDRNDPSKGFTSFLGPPRLSTPYFALRNRPSILVETHSFKPFKKRVLATRDFLVELIREVGRTEETLIAATKTADERIVKLGHKDAAPSEMILSFKLSETPDTVSFPIYKSELEPSVVFGGELIRYERGVVDELEVPWSHGVMPDKVVPRPRGYFILPGWPIVEETLRAHGIKMVQLKQPIEAEVETLRIENPRYDEKSYQGEIRTEVDVVRALENRTIPAGTLFVSASQPDFETAAHLLEPEAPDSLVRWGWMRSVLERKSYINPRVLEDKAKVLIENPEIRGKWEEALKDKEFAADRGARFVWWYRKTKHWDEQVGLLPAMRVMVLPEMGDALPME